MSRPLRWLTLVALAIPASCSLIDTDDLAGSASDAGTDTSSADAGDGVLDGGHDGVDASEAPLRCGLDGGGISVGAISNEKDQGPILQVADVYVRSMSLMHDGATYKLWWDDAEGTKIQYLESSAVSGPWHAPDNQTPDTSEVVLQRNPDSTSFDTDRVGQPSVLRVNGTYYLYYQGLNNGVWAIGVATSTSGRVFTRPSGPSITMHGGQIVSLVDAFYAGGLFHVMFNEQTGGKEFLGLLRSPDPELKSNVEEWTPAGWAPGDTRRFGIGEGKLTAGEVRCAAYSRELQRYFLLSNDYESFVVSSFAPATGSIESKSVALPKCRAASGLLRTPEGLLEPNEDCATVTFDMTYEVEVATDSFKTSAHHFDLRVR